MNGKYKLRSLLSILKTYTSKKHKRQGTWVVAPMPEKFQKSAPLEQNFVVSQAKWAICWAAPRFFLPVNLSWHENLNLLLGNCRSIPIVAFHVKSIFYNETNH